MKLHNLKYTLQILINLKIYTLSILKESDKI